MKWLARSRHSGNVNSSPVIRKTCQLYISRILWFWLSWLRRLPHGTFAARGVLRRDIICHCRMTQLMTLAIENKLYREKRCDVVLGLIIVCFSISRSFWNGKIGNWVTLTMSHLLPGPPPSSPRPTCGCRWVFGWGRKSEPENSSLPWAHFSVLPLKKT